MRDQGKPVEQPEPSLVNILKMFISVQDECESRRSNQTTDQRMTISPVNGQHLILIVPGIEDNIQIRYCGQDSTDDSSSIAQPFSEYGFSNGSTQNGLCQTIQCSSDLNENNWKIEIECHRPHLFIVMTVTR